ncbi:MAG: trypsin-like peptidase domain-containing protein [Gemmataceae bacterium]|nr:trypsin-like peptidase domain-containing protein [Gemmataceae bacterium]
MSAPLLLGLCSLFAGPPLPHKPGKVGDSVVKVTAMLRLPNPLRPWAQSKAQEVAGTGVVIDGDRILTNAHVVVYATEVHVQPGPGGEKFAAKVESFGSDVDLAVLTVADKRFFGTRRPLPRSALVPAARDTVEVYGFPVGGEEMSVTKGVVSRTGYSPEASGVVLQVSAAINPGNSGGPAVVNGRMVGVVFGRLQDAEGIGYVIPNDEIDLYFANVQGGRYAGKYADATRTFYQTAENEGLRSMLKLEKKAKGVLALPMRSAGEANPFREFDLITRIGRHAIDQDGMVRLGDGQRVPFHALIPRLARDGAVPLSVLRGGKAMRLALPVTRDERRLLREFKGDQPEWFIHGPLAFSSARWEAAGAYLKLNPMLIAGNTPLVSRRTDRASFPGEELVVVTHPMFDHKIAKGYSDPLGRVVESVNGQRIRNLRHLVEVLRDGKDEFVRFRFAEEGAEVIVFRRAEMAEATAEVMEEAGIAPSRRGSPEMLKVWRNKGKK